MSIKRSFSGMSTGAGNNAQGPLAVVSSYTRFDNLAHGPRGLQAKNSMTVFRLNPSNGCLNKLYTGESDIPNPAFLRWHPTANVLYGCTEDVKQNGQIIAWEVDAESGALTKIDSADAQGTSTCFLCIDHDVRNMLVVNYWDATIGVLPLKPNGTFAAPKLTFVYDPKGSMGMQVSADKHVNHSENDANAQAERQKDPHSHAIVLDPYKGVVAYVPDLGKDCIRELHYDAAAGKLAPLGTVPSGLKQNGPEGPRYIEFHAQLPVAYVVNELASEVAVFVVDRNAIIEIARDGPSKTTPRTLTYVQAISTVPPKWKRSQNTCGRVVIHPSGRFVLCSNRGHDSVAVFRVELEAEIPGMLSLVGISHTTGMTPRHFKFDPSGQWLLAANQDSNSVATFNFNAASGEMTYVGMQHQVPSPNFVACFSCHQEPYIEGVIDDLEEAKQKMRKTSFKLRGGSEASRGLGGSFTP
jgi:6-phosphogluconolactonase (cycloisomerase 2 family)